MAFVVTVEDVTPPPRGDGIHWDRVLAFEGSSAVDAGSLVQTIGPGAAFPTDADPANPMTRMITVTGATADSGKWYSFVFKDAAGNFSPRSAPTYNGSTAEVNYRPSVREVAARVRNRTIDSVSNKEIGTFTENTEPTAAQVEDIIDSAVDELIPLFGDNVADDPVGPDVEAYRTSVRATAAILAAAMVELTYFGKEVARGNSPYDKMIKEYERKLAFSAQMLGIILPGAATGSSGGGGGTATNPNVWIPLGSHYAQWDNDPGDTYENPITRPF
jgi:hypothetical protein